MADKVRIPSKPYMVSTEQWKNAAIALEVAVVKLEAELRAMTIDRDLWQSDHNEDCPNAASLESIKSLHADIVDQGSKIQIAASGESKYGSMSAGEYIDWVAEMLEGK